MWGSMWVGGVGIRVQVARAPVFCGFFFGALKWSHMHHVAMVSHISNILLDGKRRGPVHSNGLRFFLERVE